MSELEASTRSTSTSRRGMSRTSASSKLRIGGGSGFDSAFTARVRLYLKIITVINICLCAVGTIIFASGGDGSVAVMKSYKLASIYGVTAGIALLWFLVSRSRPTFIASIFIAGITTVALSATMTLIATDQPVYGPRRAVAVLFSMCMVAILLVLRSSLIPSPAFGTAIAGTLCVAFPVYASTQAGAGWVFIMWTTVLSGIFVAVTTVTSYTIYGMERRVRAATLVGQYQIEKRVGQGGMGEVFLAKHALLQRPTAIKLLRDATEASARDRFKQEVQTASSLTHPNTVEIYDYGRTPEGIFYFAMEYVDGPTLESVVEATGAMPPARVVHLLRQAAGSLGEAHRRGLVHRDVKPSNLMLCERGGIFDTLKVMDFGLVRDVTDQAEEADGALTGTPLYLSPEAILDADGAVPQSDVYALAATAFFLLTGHPPFVASSLVALLSDHLAAEPPALEIEDKQLAGLLRQCLAKEPADRPADADAFADALESCETFGLWKSGDASTWWAEHQAVVSSFKHVAQADATEHWSTSARLRGRSAG